MLESAVDHFVQNVLAAARDYEAAERELTAAFQADNDPCGLGNGGPNSEAPRGGGRDRH